MNKLARIAVFFLVVCFVLSPALVLADEGEPNAALAAEYAAQKATAKSSYGYLGIGIGAGLAGSANDAHDDTIYNVGYAVCNE